MNRIIRILLATLTGVGVLFGVVAIGAPAAIAANTKYVTPAEYRKVRLGMPMKQVHHIFGDTGRQAYKPLKDYDGKTYVGRDYRAKAPEGGWSKVALDYKKVNGTWKADYKWAGWDTWWVTKAEYKQLHYRMPMKQVHRIFDTKGLKLNNGYRIYPYGDQFGTKVIEVFYSKVNGTWKVDAYTFPYNKNTSDWPWPGTR